MDREHIDAMLGRIAAIRGEVDNWGAGVRPLTGGKEACEAITNGLIDLKWCLEAALEADGKHAEEP